MKPKVTVALARELAGFGLGAALQVPAPAGVIDHALLTTHDFCSLSAPEGGNRQGPGGRPMHGNVRDGVGRTLREVRAESMRARRTNEPWITKPTKISTLTVNNLRRSTTHAFPPVSCRSLSFAALPRGFLSRRLHAADHYFIFPA